MLKGMANSIVIIAILNAVISAGASADNPNVKFDNSKMDKTTSFINKLYDVDLNHSRKINAAQSYKQRCKIYRPVGWSVNGVSCWEKHNTAIFIDPGEVYTAYAGPFAWNNDDGYIFAANQEADLFTLGDGTLGEGIGYTKLICLIDLDTGKTTLRTSKKKCKRGGVISDL